ncbi:MAG TPA: hypothetical protein VHL11_06805, partial [Phototrophicaceae bacterium]|nr:hypothetical protein [Phototrophicaceae bacterium]
MSEKLKSDAGIGTPRFTLDEVDLNRQGKLSSRQLNELKRNDTQPIDTMFLITVFGIVVILGVIGLTNPSVMNEQFWLMFLMTFAIGIFTWRTIRQAQQETNPGRPSVIPGNRTVLHIDGKPRLQTRPDSGFVYLEVQRLTFEIQPANAAFFVNPGTYRVYYLSGPGVFLSAE